MKSESVENVLLRKTCCLYLFFNLAAIWAHFGWANCDAIVGSSPGNAGYQPALPRSDLNLREVRLLWPGWPGLSPYFLFETLAEVDFYSYRPRDLTLQASQAASLSRGAGSQYHGQNKLRSADEELLRNNFYRQRIPGKSAVKAWDSLRC